MLDPQFSLLPDIYQNENKMESDLVKDSSEAIPNVHYALLME